MSQSSSIGFALTVGFIVYITVRGELPAYLCIVGIGSNCPTPPATVNSSTNSTGSSGSNSTTNITTTNTSGTPSSLITNPPSSTTNIGTPPVSGNVGTSSSTITYGNSGGTDVGCDVYGDTDPTICAAINSLNSGYQVNGGTDNGTGTGGDNGAGDYE